MARVVSLEKAFPSRDDSDVFSKIDDPRLRRLAETRIDNRDEMRADRRRIRLAEIISTEEEVTRKQEWADKEEDDEDALEERRRRIKEKLRQRELEEAALLPVEEEEEVEEESEYETDSDEEMAGMAMVKPVFVPKSERDTIAERERLEAEEQALEEKVSEEIGGEEDVDTDDEMNEAEEYEAWKVREIARIKRDREDREAMLKEREEIERVRNMTEEERRDWERKNPKPAAPPKQKWRFMQKYFHKGAFFQDESDDRAATVGTNNIFKRDFSAPTGEDNMDKTILPKVMQVKHFGRSGRAKWTHLVNEDTTDWNNL
ncbi:hypothetical protein OIU76_023133 [Salix suchowensis]|uniref:Micro-fibrillar-associated protein 1 C-terminal domain-containing protein n=1 Tax=Salix suchowensis TaxID=1278906 RepID=A0ABQ9AJV1_9ROSI|nr:hypothetical protein OIU76_023133 [Salix suchowensis]KAJ6340290.1 hypothetical protein OIU77_008116 [Salix suchowensis]